MSRRHDPVSFGSPRFQTAEHGGFLVTDAWFAANAELPPHFHDRTVVATTITGRGDSVMAGRAYDLLPGMVITEPAGERHGNHFGRDGARVVVIQPDASRQELMRPFSSLLERPHQLADRRPLSLARRLAIEIRHPDGASALSIEALSLELLVAASRVARGRTTAGQSRAPVWMARVIDYLHALYLGPVRMQDVAAIAGVHPAHLAREFRRHQRLSPGAYIRRLRLDWTADQLATSDAPIAVIATQAGFADQSHFTRSFRRFTGVTPAAFRADIRGRRRAR